MTTSTGKSFDISKQQVWDAFRQVRKNKGAPGGDAVSLAEFEEDLGNNLYRSGIGSARAATSRRR